VAGIVKIAHFALKDRNILIAMLGALVITGIFFLLGVIVILVFMFGATGDLSLTGEYRVGEPTALAMHDIPPELVDILKSTGKNYGIPWTILAACAKHDNQFGQGIADGFLSLPDEVFVEYGQDGNMDDEIDKYNPRDAISTLANYLIYNGYKESLQLALFEVYDSPSMTEKILKTTEEYTDTIMPVINGKWPLPGEFTRVSSPFGIRIHPKLGTRRMHTGIDIPANLGTPIYPTSDGTVISAKWGGGYGNLVIINHGNNTQTYYAHLHEINVTRGQEVTRDEPLGLVGSTGVSTGPHLHFEVRLHNNPIDPEPWLR